MKWYLKCFKQYANFDGRARRKEYWMFFLFNFIFSLVAVALDNLLGTSNPEVGIGVVYGLYVLLVLVPGIAVTVRRLHDIGKSGWMILVALIPLAGPIWLLVLAVTNSDQGQNQYGENPKRAEVIA